MNRELIRRALAGIAAALAMIVLLAGVPVALWRVGGWPVPGSLPSWSDVSTSLTQSGISNTAILEVLAVVCWLAWIDLALTVVAEFAAAARGRPALQHALMRPFQPMAAQIVAAVLLAFGAMSVRPTVVSSPPLTSALARAATPRLLPPVSLASDAGTSSVRGLSSRGDAYVVRPGDTLWSISKRRLGDPLRWPRIFALNRGRGEPNGRAFTDPHWIWPGWRLTVPEGAPRDAEAPRAPAPTAVQTSPPSPAPVDRDSSAGTSAVGARPATLPSSAPATHRPSIQTPGETGPPSAPADGPTRQINLPTGGIVGMGLALATAAAVAAARRHDRRRRQVADRGRPAYLDLLTATVRRLLAAAHQVDSRAEQVSEMDEALEPTMALVRSVPGRLTIGEIAGAEITVDVGQLSGTGFIGPGSADVVRHLLVAFLQHSTPDRAAVLLLGDATEIASLAAPVPGVETAKGWAEALQQLDVEIIQRTRALDMCDVPDFGTLMESRPAEPLAAMLVIACPPSDNGETVRLASAVERSRHLGVGWIFWGLSPAGPTLEVEAGGTLLSPATQPTPVPSGARLYTLSAAAANDLLALVAASRGELSEPRSPNDRDENAAVAIAPPGVTPPGVPVELSLLGPVPIIKVHGRELDVVLHEHASSATSARDREGLRRRGREILAYLALHPEGATTETLVAALWPDDDPDAALVRLRRDIANVRDVLRRACKRRDVMFIVHRDERYQLHASLIDVDVWRVERALVSAQAATTVSERTEHLEQAVRAYSGSLLEHAPYEWVDPGLREDLTRRVADAACRLSELHDRADHLEAAVWAAETAVVVDPDAEPLYRRLMILQVRLGYTDAARRTLRVLEARLADIGTEPDEATLAIIAKPVPERYTARG